MKLFNFIKTINCKFNLECQFYNWNLEKVICNLVNECFYPVGHDSVQITASSIPEFGSAQESLTLISYKR